MTRPGVRSVTAGGVALALRVICRRLGRVAAVVNAGPENHFPALPGVRVLHVTDDWPAGADLMGLDRDRIVSVLRANVRAADLVCGVTPALVDTVVDLAPGPRQTLVLPNGTRAISPAPGEHRPADLPDGPFALVVGQLNERLDLELLTAVAAYGTDLVLLGPRTERDPAVTRALDALIAAPRVRWLGRRPQEDLDRYLRAASVGLTPYAVNAFNRASFPLKSLEYLAAGLPVVSTDLEATRWLATDLITTASTPARFAAAVRAAVATPPDPALADRRREFAGRHSWVVRAADLEDRISSVTPTGRRLSPASSRPAARC
ncbi:teichuronic acid biosynthesis glycosyltransferase TuaH [Friedmanniella endophytica]|uniref:Teichuronic acid biosynthesis glycosyltransferase TuaH n=1 Tax=Microlunatus kandeliicorticis TaxID=1759536 RepID=A0A7W3P4B8_9ACTN|nr:glycosyltransferase [Microlunatus kandeliicorticis]MBA8792702.1 teichuronic acid biosynthesis glycosyltransferase TuaH [Microlunatus kandeliicorticis]